MAPGPAAVERMLQRHSLRSESQRWVFRVLAMLGRGLGSRGEEEYGS